MIANHIQHFRHILIIPILFFFSSCCEELETEKHSGLPLILEEIENKGRDLSHGHQSNPTTLPQKKETEPSSVNPKSEPKVALSLKSGKSSLGLDVSDNVGSIDWPTVKAQGYQFAYAKASGGFSNADPTYQDRTFHKNWPEMKAAGITRGAYHMFDLTSSGNSQAQTFLDQINRNGGHESSDLPPVLDVEWSTDPRDGNPDFPSHGSWREEALIWLEAVESAVGIRPMIYADEDMAKNHFDDRFAGYPLWIAAYRSPQIHEPTSSPPNPPELTSGPWQSWTMWQYSAYGKVEGIGDGIDLDVLAMSPQELIRQLKEGSSAPAVASQKTASKEDSESPQLSDHKRLLVRIDGVDVYQTDENKVIYEHGMMVDADGSPWAYHPPPDEDKGLDALADAGHTGNWWGIVTRNGKPVIQDTTDPAPGFYVSPTSLENPKYDRIDPNRYVNASSTPYFVLPIDRHDFGGALGDIAAVIRKDTKAVTYAIAGDGGPYDKLGEASVKTAQILGINDSAIDGGVDSGIIYVFFPNSGDGTILSPETIQSLGEKHFKAFGGMDRVKRLLNISN